MGGKRLSEVKKDLFFQLQLPSSIPQQEDMYGSERTPTTAVSLSSTCLSQEGTTEEEDFFGMMETTTTTTLAPRIMMFYQDDTEDETKDEMDDDHDIIMNMSSSASTFSFYKQEQEQDDSTDIVTITHTPSPVSASASSTTKLSSLVDIALSLGSSPVVRNNDSDGQQENNDEEYGIFLSFSEDKTNDQNYTDYTSLPAFKYNVFRDPAAAKLPTTAGREYRGHQQHWIE